ncbi:hypothetical protein B7494_g7803 [Chlorociboria aeruginascens]|nr:hypothetical protein B7494_g7803 [Chlorociboria aeruginascens]
MAEQANASTAFPTPPPFWQHFTLENLNRIVELRRVQLGGETKKTDTNAASFRPLDLPTELRYLQPPEPPADGIYQSFGDYYNLKHPLPSLEERNIPQLYTPPTSPTRDGKHVDRALTLKRLAKSLLLNFLEFFGIMSVNPIQYREKLIDIVNMFYNVHHLLNEYRPHQARESLIQLMQDQLDKSRAETDSILKMKEKVEGVLEGFSQAKLAEDEDTAVLKVKEDGNRYVWEAMEREFG